MYVFTGRLVSCFCFLFLVLTAGASSDEVRIRIAADEAADAGGITGKLHVPVDLAGVLDLKPEELSSKALSCLAARVEKPIPLQYVNGHVWALIPVADLGKDFILKEVPESPGAPFKFWEGFEGRLQLCEHGQMAVGYVYGDILKPGIAEDRRRASYFSPIPDLDGQIISDDFPKDHPHHRGLFSAWPKVTVGEKQLDMWHLQGVWIRFEKWITREVGPVCAVLGVDNGWFLADGTEIVDEKLTATVFRSGPVGRIMDVELKLRAVDKPVRIAGANEKGYGGFSFRPAPRREEVITTANGPQEDSDLIPSPWGDFSAKFGKGDSYSGLAIFQHPENPKFPCGWCLRHYGFLGVDFPGTEPFELRPDKPVVLKFRVWVHRGNAEDGNVKEVFALYHESPQVHSPSESSK